MPPHLTFNKCQNKSCVPINITNDAEIEKKVETFAITLESVFAITLERIPDLDERIKLDPAYGEINITDNDCAEYAYILTKQHTYLMHFLP